MSLLALWLAAPLWLAAQPNGPRLKGALGITDENLFEMMLYTAPGIGSNTRQDMEHQSVKAYLMPIRSLGQRGNDWSYALATCLEFYVNLNSNYKDNLSPDYISLSMQSMGQRPGIEDGLKFLALQGDVSAAIVPYDAASIPPSVYGARVYRIANFLHLFRETTRPKQKTFEVKRALMRGNPVLVDLLADADFRRQQGQHQWTPNPVAGTQRFAVVTTAFDETRQAFELRLPWGADWGVNGHIWISYEDFERAAQNGYVMVPEAVN